MDRLSRKRPPLGPSSNRVAAQTIPVAPSSTRRPSLPPISVATHPEHTALTRTRAGGSQTLQQVGSVEICVQLTLSMAAYVREVVQVAARSYIDRFRLLSWLICPPVCPLLYFSLMVPRTASMSRRRIRGQQCASGRAANCRMSGRRSSLSALRPSVRSVGFARRSPALAERSTGVRYSGRRRVPSADHRRSIRVCPGLSCAAPAQSLPCLHKC